jgi:hypothetical protein
MLQFERYLCAPEQYVLLSSMCLEAYTLPLDRVMLLPLRGRLRPREGAGQLPVLLLEIWASYPTIYLPPSRNASHRSCGGARKGEALSR